MAAAYPQEIADADRWVHDAANAGLMGDAVAAALGPIDWDPAVKSLVPFPQVLDTLAQHLDWTQQLGEAFIAQQADVMRAVQDLRRDALAHGSLRSTAQLAVLFESGVIVIEPASSDMLYVPVYDPMVTYGTWPYPEPPVVIYPPRPYVEPIIFGVGFAIVRPFWGWSRCDWSHHRLDVDPPRVNAINARIIEREHRPRITRTTWRVDPHHRRDIPAPVRGGASAVPPPAQTHSVPSHTAPAAVQPTQSSAHPRAPQQRQTTRPSFQVTQPSAAAHPQQQPSQPQIRQERQAAHPPAPAFGSAPPAASSGSVPAITAVPHASPPNLPEHAPPHSMQAAPHVTPAPSLGSVPHAPSSRPSPAIAAVPHASPPHLPEHAPARPMQAAPHPSPPHAGQPHVEAPHRAPDHTDHKNH